MLIKVSIKRVMGLCSGDPMWRAQMHAGVTIHQLSLPGPACTLRHHSNEAVCACSHSLLELELWGPPQVCCGFRAARRLGWCAASCSIVCLSPVTLPERILVVLCGQEKPQLFISSKVCLVLWATVFFCTLYKTERERDLAGRGSLDASCSSSMSPGEC